MNILVAAMFEGDTQNPKIMRILCSEWEKMGHNVIRFFPCSTKESFSEQISNKNVYPIFMPTMSAYDIVLRQLVINRNSLIKLLKIIIRHPIFMFEYLLRRISLIDDYLGKPGQIKKEIQKACKKNNFDIIVVGSNPFFLAYGVSKARCQALKVWFQMDPHSNNGMIQNKKLKREIKSESYVYAHMDKVFVQPNSYSEIISTYGEYTSKKVFPTNFPLINLDRQINENKAYFLNNTINCVYSGALMMPIRRPEYMFSLFSNFVNKSIHLYVWCGNLSDDKKYEMISMMPSNVTFCGSLSQKEMQQVLGAADFLVSLGNTITNQLPSKILDYISFRKPIINIYKNEDCPTRPLLSNYPLAISISESEDVSTAAHKVENFINESKGNLVDSISVYNNYHDYLPKVVAEYVLSKFD